MARLFGRVNLGLVLSLLSSLLSLPLSKRYHVGMGVCFTLLAAVHTWQHRKQFSHQLHKERQNMGLSSLYENLLNPSLKEKLLLKQIQVLHYIPGRVRLYSQHIVDNPEVVRQVTQYLNTIPEIKQFSVNTATGSLLIQYSPQDVACNPFLQKVEQLVVKQYGR